MDQIPMEFLEHLKPGMSSSEFAGCTHTVEAVAPEPRDRSSRQFTDYTHTAVSSDVRAVGCATRWP